jgi:hypothetical protein
MDNDWNDLAERDDAVIGVRSRRLYNSSMWDVAMLIRPASNGRFVLQLRFLAITSTLREVWRHHVTVPRGHATVIQRQVSLILSSRRGYVRIAINPFFCLQ